MWDFYEIPSEVCHAFVTDAGFRSTVGNPIHHLCRCATATSSNDWTHPPFGIFSTASAEA